MSQLDPLTPARPGPVHVDGGRRRRPARRPSGIATVLRHRAGVAHPHEPAPAVDPTAARRRRRWTIVWILLGLVAAFFLDKGVGQVTHDTRQQHLSYDITQPIVHVGTGQALLNLQIPSIGVNQIVVQGASSAELRSGPGHVEGTAAIGGKGNAVILGRRQRYAGPFGRLDKLKKGAEIAVQTRQHQVRLYKVESVKTVDDSSAAPVAVTKDERLTLVTSAGGWFPDQRVVVTAVPKSGYAAVIGKPSKGGPVPRSALDQRPASPVPGGLLVWAMIAALVAVVVIGARELNRRYSTLVAFAVLSPIVALVALVAFYSLDIILASTV